jgi:uncharacterized protein YjbI with pentapeptide repeats
LCLSQIKELDFIGTNLDGADLTGATLENAQLEEATIGDVTATNTDFPSDAEL